MARRWTAVFLLAAAGLVTGPRASGQAVNEHGCAFLADTVQAAVLDFLAAGHAGPRPVATAHSRARYDDAPYACGRTAAVASAAFGFAFARVDVQVGWPGAGQAPPAGYCGLHDVKHCRPHSRNAVVTDAWQAVTAGLARHMPFGTDGDVCHFRAQALAETLAAALEETVGKLY